MNYMQFPQLKNFWYNSGTIANEEKSYNKRYLPQSFSKYKKTSPKLVHSYETSGPVMHEKFQLISTKMQRFLIKTGSTSKEPLGGQMGKIMGKLEHN